MERLPLQLFAEIEQRLQQLAFTQPVRPRPVGPLAITRSVSV